MIVPLAAASAVDVAARIMTQKMADNMPYKGATQAATDIASGQIPVGFQGLGTVAALVRGGQLKLIGVTSEKRMPQFPDVPTVSESALPGFFFNSWLPSWRRPARRKTSSQS